MCSRVVPCCGAANLTASALPGTQAQREMQRSLEQHSLYLGSLMRDAASHPPASAAPAADAAKLAAPAVPKEGRVGAAAAVPDDITASYLPADSQFAATETHFGDGLATDDGVGPPLDLLPGDACGISFPLGDGQQFGDAMLAPDAGGWPLTGPGLDDAGLGSLQDEVADWF